MRQEKGKCAKTLYGSERIELKTQVTNLHIANTDFEFELAETQELPLETALRRNPIVHQLQFLPLLYKEQEEGVCVTDTPLVELPCYLFSDHLPFQEVQSWGASRCVAKWAQLHGLAYHMPSWEIVQKVNSKAFSFEQTEPLPQGELMTSWSQLELWMKQVEGPKVLKSCFGLSGQGHLVLPAPSDKIKRFAEKEFHASRPIIAEPWVTRRLDFSTQWVIHSDQSILYVGATLLLSDAQGRYAGTQVGHTLFGKYSSQLEEHKKVALRVLTKMASLGFFGNVGIDAMIWGDDILHPIVEINARKTMGWVALQIAKRLFPNQTIQVSYTSASRPQGLLPQGVVRSSGEVQMFHRNLFVDTLA